jgi:hypothetical protein
VNAEPLPAVGGQVEVTPKRMWPGDLSDNYPTRGRIPRMPAKREGSISRAWWQSQLGRLGALPPKSEPPPSIAPHPSRRGPTWPCVPKNPLLSRQIRDIQTIANNWAKNVSAKWQSFYRWNPGRVLTLAKQNNGQLMGPLLKPRTGSRILGWLSSYWICPASTRSGTQWLSRSSAPRGKRTPRLPSIHP